VILEVACQLAGGRQRETELAGELADRALALRPDLREHADVPAAERRVAAHQLEQLGGRPPPAPEAAQHAAQQAAQFPELLLIGYHRVTITESEAEEVNLPMCGSHGHRRGRRGFPDREQLVERLRRYQEHLEHEQQKVKELLERLADSPEQTQQV
jgi:hypothetical protein